MIYNAIIGKHGDMIKECVHIKIRSIMIGSQYCRTNCKYCKGSNHYEFISGETLDYYINCSFVKEVRGKKLKTILKDG